ncbi:hypothetical protein F5050DRAFT_1810367 [Lentinula boryana]|uniref:Uncharacterized protein n=1 Tax=Lentinula boryana TaxID=40481 RepID=A0ABQ8Q433_9AGAR|nr:hypothetical protein F5050DRAFT_1810367 [Lentinula boryana]
MPSDLLELSTDHLVLTTIHDPPVPVLRQIKPSSHVLSSPPSNLRSSLLVRKSNPGDSILWPIFNKHFIMRFYAVLLISSLLATVLAAPHDQLNRGSDTASLGRRGGTFSKSSPTQAAVQSPAQPSAKSENLPTIELDEKDIGKDILDNHDYQFFDYSLAHYNGEQDLIFRDFGKDKDNFMTQIEKSKNEGLYIASGVFYDPRKSRLPTSLAKSTTVKSMKSDKHSSFVIILRKSRQSGNGPRPDSGLAETDEHI